MPLILYVAVAAFILWLSHRFLIPLSRAAAVILFLLPFVFVGFALVSSRVYAPVDHPWDFVPLNWMKADYGLTAAHNGVLSDVASQMIPWRAAVRWSYAHGEWPLWNRFILGGDILAPAAQPAAFSPFTLIALLLPPALSMTFTAAIAHLVAALGAFLFARELGCREASALVAASGFTYATSIALFILWPLGFSWCLAPFVFFAVRRASMPLLTIAFSLLLLAGHPETALHVAFLAAIYALVVVPRHAPRLALAGVMALLICAIQILPLLDAAPQTHEYVARKEIFAKQPRGIEANAALQRLKADFELARDPKLPPDTAAVGFIVLALALYGARRSWFFTTLAIFGLLAHSEWKPLARLLQKLPLFDQALNERFSFAAAMALAILAALGTEELFRSRIAWIAQFLFVAILVQRYIAVGDTYHSFEQRVAYPPIPILEPLKNVREPFRITGHGLAFIPNMSALYGLEDVRGYEAMTFRRTFETYPLWCIEQPVWFNRVDDLTRPLLSMMNVRYAITWDRDPPPPGWREVARQKGSMLIENTRALDRAFVPRTVRIGHDALREMASETDFAQRAWIEAPLAPQERANGPGTVITRPRKLGYDLDVTMQNDGWVVASLPAWRGWRAYVDGKRIETQFANHAFLGIHVPRGTHRVRLTFYPRAFVIGRAVSLIALIAFITALTIRSQRALPKT